MEVFGGLVCLGDGNFQRLEGGQAVVQMFRDNQNSEEYAAKFFLSEKAFEAEVVAFTEGRNPLTQFLPEIRTIKPKSVAKHEVDNVQVGGQPLPSCIVMERGESLDIWTNRAKPDRAQAFAVRCCCCCMSSTIGGLSQKVSVTK